MQSGCSSKVQAQLIKLKSVYLSRTESSVLLNRATPFTCPIWRCNHKQQETNGPTLLSDTLSGLNWVYRIASEVAFTQNKCSSWLDFVDRSEVRLSSHRVNFGQKRWCGGTPHPVLQYLAAVNRRILEGSPHNLPLHRVGRIRETLVN